jgi:hypothetical protein
LEIGLQLSSEAFLALSKRFNQNIKEWSKADKNAQRTRHRKPEAMDIYDTCKGNGVLNAFIKSDPHL